MKIYKINKINYNIIRIRLTLRLSLIILKLRFINNLRVNIKLLNLY